MGSLIRISPFPQIYHSVLFSQGFDNTSHYRTKTWLSGMFDSNQREGDINKQKLKNVYQPYIWFN